MYYAKGIANARLPVFSGLSDPTPALVLASIRSRACPLSPLPPLALLLAPSHRKEAFLAKHRITTLVSD